MSTSVSAEKKPEFSRAAYLRAKVLDGLASQCHEQHLLSSSLGQDEMADGRRCPL
ncbi:hypothetical protein [Paraburkholderia caledonica]|uniref:hypothetical protein n=1 Tax=Paraburkholderia caledonica TaxID=134536 RepID=UPI001374E2A3|nr:hypothetical protein [Paraburkholderia caledonica]